MPTPGLYLSCRFPLLSRGPRRDGGGPVAPCMTLGSCLLVVAFPLEMGRDKSSLVERGWLTGVTPRTVHVQACIPRCGGTYRPPQLQVRETSSQVWADPGAAGGKG